MLDCPTLTQGEIMANHIVNDRGETVLAMGAPGSQARFKAEHPDCYRQAEELIKTHNPLNLIFKDGVAVGTLVNTSEGFCAEHFTHDQWLYSKEFPGEDGFYDLWKVLEENGYKVWPGAISNRTFSLAKWLFEQSKNNDHHNN
jgi:hypothetical protein